MKKLFIVTLLALSLTACGSGNQTADYVGGDESQFNGLADQAASEAAKQNEGGEQVEGLTEGFPEAVPLLKGAKIIESSQYDENHFTVLYNVKEDYETVLAFYKEELGFDESYVGESDTYVDGIELNEDVYIKGLTIETTSDGVNVYMTLEVSGEVSYASDDEGGDDAESSEKVNYETVAEQPIPEAYQEDIVPIFEGAKLIDSSFAPSKSGYAIFVAPKGTEEEIVAFYEDAFGVSAKVKPGNQMQVYYANMDANINGWRVSMEITVTPVYSEDPVIHFIIDK